MRKQKEYPGIDYFRMIAAVMIVMIHTSPLASLSGTGDFLLTRVLARTAVPFFFMTSGFFLFQDPYDPKKLTAFLKKTAKIYGAAILLYLPVNIYNGYFQMERMLPELLKDLIFDGTFYHLWYLPASMLGGALAWYLITKFSYRKAFLVTGFLFVIGLFGDSYYGIAEKLPFLKNFYDQIFMISDHTRNGLFFAPLFFVLGGYFAEGKHRRNVKKSIIKLISFLILMITEAMLLHHFSVQRHDSMYFFLPPVLYGLFGILLQFRGKRHEKFRTVSFMIYLIHPWMILVVRILAKLLHLQEILIENSLVHFFMVCLLSLFFGMTALVLKKEPKVRETYDLRKERTWLEIDLEHLKHNVQVLKKIMPKDCELMAVVKSQAYGHGAKKISCYLNDIGVSAFATATIEEAIQLRNLGISGEILILGYTDIHRAKDLAKYDLTQTLIGQEYASALEKQGYPVKSHLKIDTGMHRLGFEADDIEGIRSAFAMNNLKITGIFTHLCVSDSLEERDIAFTKKQIKRFYDLLDQLKMQGIKLPKIHIQSSYGLLNYPELKCDYVRVGIALYGVLSSPKDRTKLQPDLKPVLSMKTQIALIREIRAGETVGYGRTFTAERDSRIAILPAGYADGYPRNLSCGKGTVLINGKKAPVIGKICMDQMAVDVTEIPEAKVGMTVTLIGTDGEEEMTAPLLAENAESISNELLSRMGQRVKIV